MERASQPLFSIVLLTYKRLPLLDKLLESIFACDSALPYEVVIIVNGDDHPTFSHVVRKFGERPEIKVIEREEATNGTARNAALDHVTGHYVCFLDDDLVLPPDYFREAIRTIHAHPDADVFGGPDRTPPDATHFERCVGLVLTSPLATWRTRTRHTALRAPNLQSSETQLILCNLWVKTSLFSRNGFRFDETLLRNEENLLLYLIRRARKKLVYVPSLFVFHRRRPDLYGVAFQAYRAGLSRLKTFVIAPFSVEAAYFIPSLFLGYLFVLPFHLNLFTAAPLGLYLALSSASSLWLALRNRFLAGIFTLFQVQVTINLCYGFGFLVGCGRYLFAPTLRRLTVRMEPR